MWVDNIRMDLGEIGWGDVDWIGVPQDSSESSCERGDEPLDSTKRSETIKWLRN
jgi:hypothetical protein